MRFERRHVLRRAIAFVRIEAVFGILLMQRLALPIARDFGDDGGGGDRRHECIASYDSFG